MTEQQINKSYHEFLSIPYPGVVPEWIWKKLPVAILHLPGTSVPFPSEKIIGILYQRNEVPTIQETGMAVNLLLSVAPVVLGWKLEVFLEKKKDLEVIRDTINMLKQNHEDAIIKNQQPLPAKLEVVKN